MEKIIVLVVGLYIISVCVNYLIIDKARLFDVRVNVGFTIVYLLLSPLVLPHAIGKAMEVWYQVTANKKAIITTIRMEIADTKYDTISDQDLYLITGVLAEHLEYAEMESFEAIFEDLEKNGWIETKDGINYYYVEQTGLEE